MTDSNGVKRQAERKNTRRKGRSLQRQRALDVLYEADVRSVRREKLPQLLERRSELSTAQQPIQSYGIQVVQAFIDHRDDIDAMIDAASPDWSPGRMSAVDRNVLRIGVAEMMYCGLDRAVAVKEAASLAREFSNDQAVPFVMGVLNRVADIWELETSGTGFAQTQILGDLMPKSAADADETQHND